LLLAGIGGGLAVAWLMARSLTRAARDAASVANDVATGKLDSHIDTSRADEIGDLLKAMQRMQRDLRERIERDQAAASENLRIRTALASSGTRVMTADAERKVIYANQAVADLLRQYQDDVRASLPEIEPAQLVGTRLDALREDPGQLAAMLEAIEDTHQNDLALGQAHFRESIARVDDADGALLGYVVEWRDRTPQVRLEAELGRVAEAAAVGDLPHRSPRDGQQGCYLQLATRLNARLDANASSLEQVSHVPTALADGDLTVRMEGEYQGVFASMRENANA